MTTAILDRIIHRASINHLNGDSSGMKCEKTIFQVVSVTNELARMVLFNLTVSFSLIE